MVTRGTIYKAGSTPRRKRRSGGGRELVARDAGEVGGVDEELALRDADREQIGHVVVGDGVLVAPQATKPSMVQRR
jgi:hypothetical protein